MKKILQMVRAMWRNTEEGDGLINKYVTKF